MKLTFTEEEIARVCDVAGRTVNKWFDSGRLKQYRVPGLIKSVRRTHRTYLIRFLKEHGMPLGELENDEKKNILLIGCAIATRSSLHSMLSDDELTITVARSGFQDAIETSGNYPECIVIDFLMGRVEALMAAENIRRNSLFNETAVIGLLSVQNNAAEFDRSLFTSTLLKSFHTSVLAAEIVKLVIR